MLRLELRDVDDELQNEEDEQTVEELLAFLDLDV